MGSNTTRTNRPFILIICVILILMIISGIAIAIWKATSGDDDNNKTDTFFNILSYDIGKDNVTLDVRQLAYVKNPANLPIVLGVGMSTERLKITHKYRLPSNGVKSMIMEWADGMSADISKSHENPFLFCLKIDWKIPQSRKETGIDCVNISESFWYGGFQESYQHWPTNNLSVAMSPFVSGDAYFKRQIGNVIEPLFVSSLGIGIYVEETVPLFISFNHYKSGHLCLKAKTGTNTPFFQSNATPVLTYHVCSSINVTQLWKEMTRAFIPKPKNIPSPSVFRYPIWSTWAMCKAYINETTTLEYADDIKQNGFGISQLEIDDNWTPRYGDFTFDSKKFPNAKSLIMNLTSKGIPVTVWVHPFFNNNSRAFNELSRLGFLVKNKAGNATALTSWWRGDHAGILDVTNPKAVQWYRNKMQLLKSNFNVTSFKFDAGEVNWLPREYDVRNKMASPNYYSKFFAKMAYDSDTKLRRQEVRVGFKTQDLPILVRMIDRDSSWSHERGLKSLIPTALTFSIMGYHFILPDMIGGNAYDPDDLDKTVLPDAELFVRWLQVTTFMPTLQFSIAPWLYNDTILNISRKFVQLHEMFADKIIHLANESVTSGEPIIRPLWWIAPNDSVSLVLDSEFLLGDDVLVAPVVVNGAKSRDVYLPQGRWRNGVNGEEHSGPIWLYDFPASLDELPYFFKL